MFELVNKSLKDAGYEVESAFDGFDAMEMIEIESYDLIVLDLNLPNMDGMEILKNLRKEDVETKVLILRRNAGFKLARAFSSLASVAAVIRQ